MQLGRALVQEGQTDTAWRSYDEFLRLWSSADAGLRMAEQARAERQLRVTLGNTRGNEVGAKSI